MLCSFVHVALPHDDVFVSRSVTTKVDTNEELDESSSDREQQLSDDSDESDSESEQEEVLQV